MKTLIKSLGISIMLLMVVSCTSNQQSDQILGVQYVYEDFWWNKYDMESAWMYDTLVFDFNKDAQKYITQPIRLQLVTTVPVSDTEIDTIPLEDVEVKQNGTLCENNIITIKKGDKEVIIGVRYTKIDNTECKHNVYLKHINPEELGMPLVIDDLGFHGPTIEKIPDYNPLAKGSLITLIAVIIFLLTWIIIAHLFVNPSVKFSTIKFDYGDGYGERRVKTSGAYEIRCTNKPMKVSFFKKLFVGNIKVEVNDFWVHPFTIKSSYNRNKLSVKGTANYTLDVDMPMRKEPFIVTNEHGNKVTIQTT